MWVWRVWGQVWVFVTHIYTHLFRTKRATTEPLLKCRMNDNKILQEYEQIRGQKEITEIECVRKIKEKKGSVFPFYWNLSYFLLSSYIYFHFGHIFPYSSSLIFIGILCHKKKERKQLKKIEKKEQKSMRHDILTYFSPQFLSTV